MDFVTLAAVLVVVKTVLLFVTVQYGFVAVVKAARGNPVGWKQIAYPNAALVTFIALQWLI